MWWEFHRLMDLTPEQLVDEDDPIGVLEPVGPLDEPTQGQADLALPLPGPGLRPRARRRSTTRPASRRDPDDKPFSWAVGDVVAVDPAALTVDIRRAARRAASARRSCRCPGSGRREHQERLLELGEWVAEHGIDGDGPHRAARDLLLGPAAAGRPGAPATPLRRPGETDLDAARRLALAPRSDTSSPIQGPPGSGKTYTGARMICTLLAAGQAGRDHRHEPQGHRQPAQARSSKAADEERRRRPAVQHGEPDQVLDDDRVVRGQGRRRRRAAGSTTAARTSPPGRRGCGRRRRWPSAVDVLFVDEAGQISLANVVAISRADRQHRPARRSAAARPAAAGHASAGRRPVGAGPRPRRRTRRSPPDRGLFLETTWRLHPDLCELHLGGLLRRPPRARGRTSRVQRLARAGLASSTASGRGCSTSPTHRRRQRVARARPTRSRRSPDRSSTAARPGPTSTASSGRSTWDDVLIVAPYNAQVGAIKRRLCRRRRGSGRSTSSRARRRRSASTR